ncbi:MAG: retropepsin-like domain-containing protein [Ardenticatenaceae bacterium]|nr:retropepsin-like domain-containing protein [Anaerolineales bacterium]MCB8920689.1 retropepsin-like domain-containing protein [Ardenticatenaceae bacterium]MCB8989649.1 retropepsin-like domain-containing protein [Ardenticatenaceae bacterium]MCB9002893.1 retropepsin-like domain-containing protein [Ardenticatenaceae bacterium]
MKIRLQDGLPFVTAVLMHQNQQIALENVLLDTGSAGTIFPTDRMLEIGLRLEVDDLLQRIRGVGGTEFVFTKQVNRIALGDLTLADFEVEVGAMDYGFPLDGIIGMDALLQVGAKIDLEQLELVS